MTPLTLEKVLVGCQVSLERELSALEAFVMKLITVLIQKNLPVGNAKKNSQKTIILAWLLNLPTDTIMKLS